MKKDRLQEVRKQKIVRIMYGEKDRMPSDRMQMFVKKTFV